MQKLFNFLSVGLRSCILASLAIYFFFWPLLIIVNQIQDPGLKNGNIPAFAYDWHRHLSEEFPEWVEERINSGRAVNLGTNDISGTEWPMFSAVYYLWATEKLQENWLQDPSVSSIAPVVYAEQAIRAATALIVDKDNANWVIQHWGDAYLEKENLFYRMLLISGLLSFQVLLGDDTYDQLLRWQVSSLATELDDSKFGVLDDYPGQCYPVDILPAIATLARASKALGLELEGMIERSIRGFSGRVLDPLTGLPSYIVDAKTGLGYGPARGVGMSFMLVWAPEVWPQVARSWYASYDDHFWQENWFLAGVREFSKHSDQSDWLMDVDSGPVLAGNGTAASAFGIAAARANGRMDHAYPLSTEAIVTSWQLPNGSLMIPKLLSNAVDAPLLGEAAMLFVFTRTSVDNSLQRAPVNVDSLETPVFVYMILLSYLLFGAVLSWAACAPLRTMNSNKATRFTFSMNLQMLIWFLCLVLVVVGCFNDRHALFVVGLIGLVLLPKKKSPSME